MAYRFVSAPIIAALISTARRTFRGISIVVI